MSDTLTNLLIKSGVTWYPKKKAEFLEKNNVVVLPCNIGDELYVSDVLFSFELNKPKTYRKVTVTSLTKKSDGWRIKAISPSGDVQSFFNSTELGKNIFVCKTDTTTLYTFPNEDNFYCHSFVVPTTWLVDIIERLDSLNNRSGVTLAQFLEEYVWDETNFIYLQAKAEGYLLSEKDME